jgi:heme-degrading monooxygenase HmoA
MLFRGKVEEYSKWRSVFDERRAMRKAAGSKGDRVFRNADNPNELVILLEWDDLDKAREFAQSEDLKKAMEQAGVSGKRETYFLNEA